MPPDETFEVKTVYCSCVKTARLFTAIPRGDADKLKPNSTPQEQGLALFYYESTNTYHVAVILELHEDYFLVVEGNYRPCKKTYRKVKWDDKSIRGFADYSSTE